MTSRSAAVALLGDTAPVPLDRPFTARHAASLGVSRRTFAAWLEAGLLRSLDRGVYAAAQAPNTVEFRARALGLVLPADSVATDRTAAWLYGLDLQRRSAASVLPALEVFRSPGHRCRRPGVVSGERALASYDVTEVAGVRVTTPLRTACDLGRRLWAPDALAALDGFLRLGVGRDRLLAELPRFKGARGVVQLRALAPLADPRSESVGESCLRKFWLDAGLPPPTLQLWVEDDDGLPRYRLDLTLPEVKYAAEYDGERFHSGDGAREHDEDRRAWLTEERGWHIEVFGKADVFAARADPIPRLQHGLVIARRRLAEPTSYPLVGPPLGPR